MSDSSQGFDLTVMSSVEHNHRLKDGGGGGKQGGNPARSWATEQVNICPLLTRDCS